MTTQECVFCRIISNEIPVEKVLENDDVFVFPSNEPVAETHLLILPKRHVANFMSLNNLAVWDAMRQTVQQLISDKNLGSAYKLVFNGGSYQHVPHLHWHLLGGKLTRHP